MILEACREAGTPEPEMKYEQTGLWVVFGFLPEHQAETPVETPAVPQETRGTAQETTKESQRTAQEIQETAQETAEESGRGTVQERALALLQANPAITRRELASRLGLSDSGVKYHLEKMKASGVIRHVGATKAGYWEVLK